MPQRKSHIKPFSTSAEILLSVGEVVEDILLLSLDKRLCYYGFDWRDELDRKEWRKRNKIMNRMEAQGLIKKSLSPERLEVALTRKGLEELVRVKVLRSDLLPPGEVCLIVFDIPESSRHVRKILRRLLEKSGFVPLQKSVWMSPFDVTRSMDHLLRLTGMTKWVKVYIAKDKTQDILNKMH